MITAGKATLALSGLNSSQHSEISASEITLNADKVINQNSRLQANKVFTLNAKQGIINHNGIIASKTDSLSINTHQTKLDNANGTLFAPRALTIQSGELDNRAGLISAKQTEINTQQHQIDNRNTQAENKGIIGVDKLSLNNLSSLNNEQGFIHSNKQLDVSVASNINNPQGILNSNEGLTLNAAQIDNKAGSITAKTAEVNAKSIDNNAVSEVGSLILGTTQLVLNAEQLNNQNTKRKTADKAPTQGIQAGELVLNANTLSNQQGGIYVADLATMTVNQTLNNQNGEVLSDNGLTIKDNGNLSLNNQDGLIQAKNQVHLTAKTLEQEGSIKTQGDLTIRLKESFTLNNAFEVGNDLDFSTQGDFTNNVALLIGNRATLSANQIINTASGEISSKNSKLTANEITNRGLIDGEQTLLNATQINNIGSGRIYGDHLALGSNQLINREENGSSATIAARKRLDFGVNKIINSNGSTMMSLGTIHFGKTLDENHQAVGLADSVQNHNAVIEALGRISFNVKGVENQHKLLKLEMQETSRIPIFEYSFGNEPQRYAKDTEGLTKIKRDNDSSRWGTNRNIKNLYALRLPDGRESEEWREYDYIRTINESMIIPAVYDEAKIISGDKIDFYSSDVKNADSKIIANTGIEYHQGAKIDNNSTLGVLITTEKGK
ncbi:hypothetical protein F480_01565 [Bibersteinia trehalosi Y31]|uniref:Uncharacterized protein n=1 Tax=Bibersteinia trehalosi Y31 TaxID=1261658 RepID=A0A179D2J9_BIBTR|nr:hypothetical protein F480_01565 [Bibersteinia trehalosi Y31]